MADEEYTLEEMFDDSEPEVPTEAEAPAETEVKAESDESQGEPEPKVDAQASDESPATTSEAEPEAEPPSAQTEPDLTPAQKGRLAATLAERDKRQKAEAEATALRERLAQYEDVEEPNQRPSVEQEMLQNKIELSRDVMSELDDKFESVYEPHFMKMVMDDEGNVQDERLLAQFQESRNPAKFARDTAKKDLQVREVTDPKYEENLRAQLRADILKEIQEAGVSAVDVPDMTNTADSGSNSVPPVKDEGVADMEFTIDQ